MRYEKVHHSISIKTALSIVDGSLDGQNEVLQPEEIANFTDAIKCE